MDTPDPHALERLNEAFFNFDEDKDGFLTLDELRVIVTSSGEAMPDVEEFLQEAQQFDNGSGMIDYKGFAAVMLSGD